MRRAADKRRGLEDVDRVRGRLDVCGQSREILLGGDRELLERRAKQVREVCDGQEKTAC